MMKYILFFIALIHSATIVAEQPEMVYKCSTLSRMIEIEEGLPPLLLSAITYVESSDMPWVIGTPNAAHRFNTKKGALAKIKELRAKRQKNFDVGCMQINHFFHKDKFQSDEEMLNPVRNIRFAAKLLKELKAETGSWEKAIAYYNSRDLRLSNPYANKVYHHWGKIKSSGGLPTELTSFANISKIKPEAKLNTRSAVSNNILQRAKIAYLTYKKTLVRK